MSPVKPSVGRLVWYQCQDRSEQDFNNGETIAPAIITAVVNRDLGIVHLKVLWNGNSSSYLTNMHEGSAPGMWSWPPRVE
jgi:hypothetical protein